MRWEPLPLLAHQLIEDKVGNIESFPLHFPCSSANMCKNHLGMFGKNTYS